MSGLVLGLLLQVVMPASPRDIQAACAREIQATAVATKLADLPGGVRAELARFERDFMRETMADSDGQLLQTDAPSAVERDYPRARFAQALLVRDQWFVQYEVSMMAGVQTVDFRRDRNGNFHLSLEHFLSGPPCASIKAALAGVRAPGGFPPHHPQPFGAIVPVRVSPEPAPRN